MLKKSYTGLIVWIVLFTASIFVLPLIPIDDDGLMTRILLAYTSLMITALMLMIFLNEKVFWFNGLTYEEAAAAGSERRKLYALRHLLRFGWFTAAYTLFAVVAQILSIPFWIDIVLFTIGSVAVAISTIRIRL